MQRRGDIAILLLCKHNVILAFLYALRDKCVTIVVLNQDMQMVYLENRHF